MEKKQRFSLRKMKNGVVSVAVGSLLVFAGAADVEASEADAAVEGEQTEEVAADAAEEAPVEETERHEPAVMALDDEGISVFAEGGDPNGDLNNGDDGSDEEPVAPAGEEVEVIRSQPELTRNEGADREEVAINVAEEYFSDAEKVVLVNQDTYTDAISATNVSQGKFPVLYTRADKLGDKTLISLGKMENLKEIYLLGGTTSINDSVKDRLTATFGDIVKRIDGLDRFEANANAIRESYAEEEEMKADHVVIATGEIYTDALYGVSYANTINAPIILSRTDHLVEESLKLIEDLEATKVTIIGGESSVTDAVKEQLTALGIDLENINRIAGENRYDGSVEVAKRVYEENPTTLLFASGDIFTDALVSAPLSQKLDAPIILVREDSMVDEVEAYLNENIASLENIYIQGGPSTISEENAADIQREASDIITAYLTLQATDENTVVATFINEDEEYNATEAIELEEALVDGEEQEITFTHSGKDYTVTVLYVTADTFVKEVDDIADVADIEKMDAEELAVVKADIEKARTFYNALTAEAKEDARVVQRAGWITSKETAVEDREAELEAENDAQ